MEGGEDHSLVVGRERGGRSEEEWREGRKEKGDHELWSNLSFSSLPWPVVCSAFSPKKGRRMEGGVLAQKSFSTFPLFSSPFFCGVDEAQRRRREGEFTTLLFASLSLSLSFPHPG